jgi:hypothetical protein
MLNIEQCDEYRDFSILYFRNHAIARAEAPYELHVRPSTYLIKNLGCKPYSSRLSVRSSTTGWGPLQMPTDLLILNVRPGTPLLFRLEYSQLDQEAGRLFREVIDIFYSYMHTKDYHDKLKEQAALAAAIVEEKAIEHGLKPPDDQRFQDDFNSVRQVYGLIKLLLENFILSHVLLIEEFVKFKSIDKRKIDWDSMNLGFREILLEKRLGLFSLGLAYDNLLQIRESCFTQHLLQLEKGVALNQHECELDWARDHAQEWRMTHDRRILFFYNQESVYYRDLFLTVLIREPKRLDSFLYVWGPRLDHSLQARAQIDKILDTFRVEMAPFSANFTDQGAFIQKIDQCLQAIKNTVVTYGEYLKLMKEKKIYLAGQ